MIRNIGTVQNKNMITIQRSVKDFGKKGVNVWHNFGTPCRDWTHILNGKKSNHEANAHEFVKC